MGYVLITFDCLLALVNVVTMVVLGRLNPLNIGAALFCFGIAIVVAVMDRYTWRIKRSMSNWR